MVSYSIFHGRSRETIQISVMEFKTRKGSHTFHDDNLFLYILNHSGHLHIPIRKFSYVKKVLTRLTQADICIALYQ